MSNQGIGTVNQGIERIKPGEFREGARGLNLGAPVPHGAVGFNRFAGQKIKKAPGPMERPAAKRAITAATRWFNEYLLQTRGHGLTENETVPPFIILVHAMELPEPDRNDCLRCLEHMQVPIATKYPITVEWGYQEFNAVPYEVRTFPIHVAISIIELCRTSIYADMPLWDEQHQKVVSRLLTDEERVSISYKKFRDPQPHEMPEQHQDFGEDDVARRPVRVEGGSGDLLMDLNPGHEPPQRVGGQDPTVGTVHGTTPFPSPNNPSPPPGPPSRVGLSPDQAGASSVREDVDAAEAAARHMAAATGLEVVTPGMPTPEAGPVIAPAQAPGEAPTAPPAPMQE